QGPASTKAKPLMKPDAATEEEEEVPQVPTTKSTSTVVNEISSPAGSKGEQIIQQLEHMSETELDGLLRAVKQQLSKKQAERRGSHGAGHDEGHGHDHAHSKWHAVVHQVVHRAQEKVGFGVAEHVLELVAETFLENQTASTVTHTKARAAKPAIVEVSTTTALKTVSLEVARIGIPLASTFLISHMVHHDVHRTQLEKRRSGYGYATLLFIIATICDGLDAIAHAAIVTCMLAEKLVDHHTLHLYHMDHHTVHELHHAARVLAVLATLSIITAELLSHYPAHHTSSHTQTSSKGATKKKKIKEAANKQKGD
ncbi:MAG: hypothetical protein SGPRY_003869, partial [Prymnesium sp.]